MERKEEKMNRDEILRFVENNRFLKLIVLLLAANNFEPICGETKLKLLVKLLDKILGGKF